MSTSLTFLLSGLILIHTSNTYTKSCYGNCQDTTITCPTTATCTVDCYVPSDRRRLIQEEPTIAITPSPFSQPDTIESIELDNDNKNELPTIISPNYIAESLASYNKHNRALLQSQCPSTFYGCCNSTINCPPNQDCIVICDRGCFGTIINAQTSTSLVIQSCGSYSSDTECAAMTVYCPMNGRGGTTDICEFQGTSTSGDDVYASDIYTQEGFRDLKIDVDLNMVNTRIHCGWTGTENSCVSNTAGTACVSGTICNDALLPTNIPTTDPTTDPTNSPTIDPTQYPTLPPTTNPSQNPSTDPTINPTNIPTKSTSNPSNDPTLQPTILPSKYPTIDPTHTPTFFLDTPTDPPTKRPTKTTNTNQNEVTESTIIDTSIDNIVTNDNNDNDNTQKFWESTLGFDLEVILIAIAILLILCCMCLFICYWCRKEKMYRDLTQLQKQDIKRGNQLSQPLLDDTDKKVELQTFPVRVPDAPAGRIQSSSDAASVVVTQMTAKLNMGESDEDDDDVDLGNIIKNSDNNIKEGNTLAGDNDNDNDIVDQINIITPSGTNNILNGDDLVFDDDELDDINNEKDAIISQTNTDGFVGNDADDVNDNQGSSSSDHQIHTIQ